VQMGCLLWLLRIPVWFRGEGGGFLNYESGGGFWPLYLTIYDYIPIFFLTKMVIGLQSGLASLPLERRLHDR